MSFRLFRKLRRSVQELLSFKPGAGHDPLLSFLLECCLSEQTLFEESEQSFNLLAGLCLRLSDDLFKQIDIKKKRLQNRQEFSGATQDVVVLAESKADSLSDCCPEHSHSAILPQEGYPDDKEYSQELQDEITQTRNSRNDECFYGEDKDKGGQEDLISSLNESLMILSHKLNVAERKWLYYQNRIKVLDEQLEFFVMNESVQEPIDERDGENSPEAGSHRMTAYIKLLQEKDDLLMTLRDENLALKGCILDLNNSVEKLKVDRDNDNRNFQEELEFLRKNLMIKEDELEESRKDISKVKDLEYELKTVLLELEVLREHKNELCSSDEHFVKLREHLSKKMKENVLLQNQVSVLEERFAETNSSEKEAGDGIREFHDPDGKFENTLNDLKDLLNRTAEEEGVESLLFHDEGDTYL